MKLHTTLPIVGLLLLLVALAAIIVPSAHATAVTCGSTPYTAADVATETAQYNSNVAGAKCLFIYSGKIYSGFPVSGTKPNRYHMVNDAQHRCGSDVTGILPSSHTSNVGHYLTPYICAPIGVALPACTDADGDGYASQASSASCNGQCGGSACLGYADCNDNNAAIHPGATEVCNGVDDNCNGQIDENPGSICGAGNYCSAAVCKACSAAAPAPSTVACGTSPQVLLCTGSTVSVTGTQCAANQVCSASSCQSCSAAAPAPSTVACGTSPQVLLCDGSTISVTGTQCGASQVCTGGACQACSAGTPDPLTVACGTTSQVLLCSGSTVPVTGTQCGAGQVCASGACISNTCAPGATQPCYDGAAGTSGVGLCKAGTQTCAGGGTWGACAGEVLPVAETCNGLDDNCNGQVDENPGAICSAGNTCSAGACKLCSASSPDPLTIACGTTSQILLCSGSTVPVAGTQCAAGNVCSAGACKSCSASAPDPLTIACGTTSQVLLCSGSTVPVAGTQCGAGQLCSNGACISNSCAPGLTQPCYAGTPGTLGVGLCVGGTQACAANGTWGSCVGQVLPVPEICGNNLDDNCDGQVDEGCLNLTNATCTPGAAQGCSIGICTGTQSCAANGTWAKCVATSGMMPETCNGLDDDCDGIVDNNIAPVRVTCGVGACAVAIESTCVQGNWTACVPGKPTTEICNNIDDDCNGIVDDKLQQACGSSIGICRQGVQTCSAGVWGSCVGGVTPQPETCDGRDNNCNGQVDEGNACLTAAPPCVENWTCGNWTLCLSLQNATLRTCHDENNCGTNLTNPILYRNCTPTDIARAIVEHKVFLPKPDDNVVILVTVVSLASILLSIGYMFTVKRKQKLARLNVADDLAKLQTPTDTPSGPPPELPDNKRPPRGS